MTKKRCGWCKGNHLYEIYHDNEWGVPVFEDNILFEFLTLEIFQAGLSWITVLRKREGFRKAFDLFDIYKIASYDFIKEEFAIDPEFLLEARLTTNSWAKEFNYFFDKYKHITKNIIYSHDDVVIKTENFYKIITDSLQDKQEEIGWVTFTNDRYYNHDGKILPNSIKDRYAIDRYNYPYMFECHKFKDVEKVYKPELLEYPEHPVKVHTPFPHFCFVSVESLEKIGHCCEWTEYTILIDDDWAH